MLFGTTRHRGLVAPTLLGLIAAPLAVLATSAPAQAAGPGLVINEVYGGGGNTIATFENDFVELRNTSTEPISLTGKSLQYRGPNSIVLPLAENVLVLPDVVVPAGETFLVKGASASSNPNPPGAPLPEPDMTTTLNMGGIEGQIYLADTTLPTNPNLENGTSGNAFDANVLDFVGYGAATSSRGSRAGARADRRPLGEPQRRGSRHRLQRDRLHRLRPAHPGWPPARCPTWLRPRSR